MFDWLLSELEDKTVRAQMLAELPRQAIDAFAWLAELTENWTYVYNVAEIYGVIGDVMLAQR